jgi:acyl-CoA hydrolase
MADKKVSDSITEWTHMLRYEDINGEDRLFGGKLVSWIDEVAGTAAIRHCGCRVTTAAIDNLQFKRGGFLGEMIVIIGRLTYVGNTSMEVRVDSYVEDLDGMRHLLNRAFFTEVAIDENGKPIHIENKLVLSNDVEREEWEGAKKRIENRKMRRREGF